MDEKARQAADAYIIAMQEQLRKAEFTDSRQERIDSFRPSELEAVRSFMSHLSTCSAQNKKLEVALELAADARKHVVTYLGLLPLIESLGVRAIFYMACDGNAEAGAKLDMISLRIFSPRIEFGTWEELAGSLAECVVIGDLDWSEQVKGAIRDRRAQVVKQVLAATSCHRILLHQRGKECIVPFPPKFGSACFIATAATGSPSAWEVQTLRAFRNEVLCRSAAGRLTSNLYTWVSPPLARRLERSPRARKLVRDFLVTPLVLLR